MPDSGTDVPAPELQSRLAALQARLAAADPPLDLAIVVGAVNLYYLAGTAQSCHLLVPREGAPRLLVRKVLERAREESALDEVRPMKSLRMLADEVRGLCGMPPWRVGMELDILPAASFATYRSLLGDRVEIADASADIAALRAVKSEWELDRIRESARINERLYSELPLIFEKGMSTYQLQALLDCRARVLGHVGLVRLRGFNIDGLIGLVVSGPTGALPGHSAFPIGGLGPHPTVAHGGDHESIREGVPIIFDYLANASGYHHDQTRMAVWGAMPEEAFAIYQTMRETLRVVEKRLRPGVAPSAIYEEALEFVAGRGLRERFLGPPGNQVPFVGHAIGLEVNETPVLARKFDAPLEAGNVIAVEPKLNHPEFGVVGVENTYVVRQNGAENLSLSSEDVIRIRA